MRKILYLLFLLSSACRNATSIDAPYLFSITERKGISKPQNDPSFLRGIDAIAHLELLKDSLKAFKIPITPSDILLVEAIRVERSDSSLFWTGKVVGDPTSIVYFTYSNDVLNGRINTSNKQYRILYSGNGVYQIAQLDTQRLSEGDDDATVPVITDTSIIKRNFVCNDPATSIDILVIYTSAAEFGAGGQAGIRSLINQSVNLTNESYRNSGVNQRINLVHAEKVSYLESGNTYTDRDRLQAPNDVKLDEVQALRQLYSADIVILIVESAQPGNCGAAFILDPVNDRFESYAFGVVKRECAADNLSFAHELGHIMGARHHDDIANTPFPWCHGHQAGGYRTVMSKANGTIRLTNFSNPAKSFPSDDRTGIPGISENYKVLNTTAATISRFRCKMP